MQFKTLAFVGCAILCVAGALSRSLPGADGPARREKLEELCEKKLSVGMAEDEFRSAMGICFEEAAFSNMRMNTKFCWTWGEGKFAVVATFRRRHQMRYLRDWQVAEWPRPDDAREVELSRPDWAGGLWRQDDSSPIVDRAAAGVGIEFLFEVAATHFPSPHFK